MPFWVSQIASECLYYFVKMVLMIDPLKVLHFNILHMAKLLSKSFLIGKKNWIVDMKMFHINIDQLYNATHISVGQFWTSYYTVIWTFVKLF